METKWNSFNCKDHDTSHDVPLVPHVPGSPPSTPSQIHSNKI